MKIESGLLTSRDYTFSLEIQLAILIKNKDNYITLVNKYKYNESLQLLILDYEMRINRVKNRLNKIKYGKRN